MCQDRRSFSSFHRGIDEALGIAFPTRLSTFQDIQAADHDREHVVEIVRDTTGELPDCFHFLALAELLLHKAALNGLLYQLFVRQRQSVSR
jgi:hypothetical protein